ncbi:MAG TPA: hypothetical protein VMI75_29435 [Polyangiaceae bacterium]|nr:hypothetical protein [Polyangiaceae bacterium]
MLAALTNNANFTTPVPALSAVAAALAALQSAESQALSRLKGAVVARNDKKAALVALLQQLRSYIQTTADADPENSAAIIKSSGLPVKKVPVHKPRVFTVKPGAVSGSVELVTATAARRASYLWGYSIDGGKTWIEVGPTLQAKTTVSGLPVGTSVQFRYRGVTKTGGTDWSQPISFLVR